MRRIKSRTHTPLSPVSGGIAGLEVEAACTRGLVRSLHASSLKEYPVMGGPQVS